MIVRIVKVAMVIALALLSSLVSFGNLTDFGSNFAFVQHVFRMDTTFPGNANLYRAIMSPALQKAGYLLIITFETATAACCWWGAFQMVAALKAALPTFVRAKRVAIAGLALGFLTWQVAFMSVGGEWFDMWMSKTWNGEQSAFRFFTTFAVVLIFVSMPNDEIVE